MFRSRLQVINIAIGGYYASNEPVMLHTVLGSCVAVCLMDYKNRIGGMNHIFLPGKPDLSKFDNTARYGINAMELLINAILRLGGKRDRLKAKLFGGASVLPGITGEDHIGKKNAEFALGFLKKESIEAVAYNLGGNRSRKLFFQTNTGDVWLKHLPAKMFPTILQSEQKALRVIQTKLEKPGEIILFNQK